MFEVSQTGSDCSVNLMHLKKNYEFEFESRQGLGQFELTRYADGDILNKIYIKDISLFFCCCQI